MGSAIGLSWIQSHVCRHLSIRDTSLLILGVHTFVHLWVDLGCLSWCTCALLYH